MGVLVFIEVLALMQFSFGDAGYLQNCIKLRIKQYSSTFHARRRILKKRILPIESAAKHTCSNDGSNIYSHSDEIRKEIAEETHGVSPLTITFVTGNREKLKEAQSILNSECAVSTKLWFLEFVHHLTSHAILCQLPFQLEPLKNIDLDELQSDVPEKIAAAKCRLAARLVGGPVIVDDTSLCFAALG